MNVCITNHDFSNDLSILKCLISFTNRKLNMRTLNDTSFLFIDRKTFFLMRSFISFCLNAANEKRAMCTIESNLKATAKATIEIEMKIKAKTRLKSLIVLNTKFKYTIDAKYFRRRSRSHLNEFEKFSDFDFWSIETTSWSFDWDIINDFETNVVNNELIIIDDEFLKSWLLS